MHTNETFGMNAIKPSCRSAAMEPTTKGDPLPILGVATLLSGLAITSFTSLGLGASTGALDTSFNVGSGSYGINTVLVQPDGRVIIAGTFTYYQYVFRQGIARLNTDASLDLSFDAASNVV